VRAFIIVQALGKIGEVSAVEPPLDQLELEAFEDDFALRLVTPATPDVIENTCGKRATSPRFASAKTGAAATRRRRAGAGCAGTGCLRVCPNPGHPSTRDSARDTCASMFAVSTI
jgi:hypothetical protein